jgi:hypothetical protein
MFELISQFVRISGDWLLFDVLILAYKAGGYAVGQPRRTSCVQLGQGRVAVDAAARHVCFLYLPLRLATSAFAVSAFFDPSQPLHVGI